MADEGACDGGAGAEGGVEQAWTAAAAQLEEDLRRRDAAPRTRRAYGVDVRQFARWAAAAGLAPEEVGPREVRRYVAALSEGGAAPTSAARKLAAVRALFASLREHGRITGSPADLVATPRRPSRLPRALKAQEVARLLESVPADTALARRDRAMFELAYASGLRAEELVTLRVEDVDWEGEQLRVEGKGGKTRYVPVGEVARAALLEHCDRRPPARLGGAALPEQVRPAPEHQRRASAPAALDGARGRGRGDLPARPAPQLRHAPAGRRRGPPFDPGAARPRERVHHAGLHSGRVS